MHPIRAIQAFLRGESYWSILLSTGKQYSELDIVQDISRGKRPLDWYQDIVATGDVSRIVEMWLHTPKGDAALKITEPNTVFLFNMGTLDNQGGRSKTAQLIGRVDDKEHGTGIAYVWDVARQQMYHDPTANVYHFHAWRPGIPDPGPLNLQAIGLRL